MSRTCMLALSAALLAVSVEANCDAQVGNLCLRTLGSSGKILFCYDGSGSAESDCFTLRLRNFEERDSSGSAISAHAVNNLGNAGFSLGTVDGSYAFPTVCDTAGRALCGTSTNGSALQAVRVPITAPVGKPSRFAVLDLTAYIMTEAGTLNFSGESMPVQKNSFKFDIHVLDYTPCGSGAGHDTCKKGNTQQTGDTFAFDVEVATRGDKALQQDGTRLKSESGGLVNFAEYRVQAVGATTWTSEQASVSLATVGGRQVITYTFKVGQAVMYDPLVVHESCAWATPSPLLFALVAALALLL